MRSKVKEDEKGEKVVSTYRFCLSADRTVVLSHGFGAAIDVLSSFCHEEASKLNSPLDSFLLVDSLLSGLDSFTMTGLTPTLS